MRWSVPLAVVAVALGSARPGTAQPAPTAVVLSGQAAPSGGNYNGFGRIMLNESGQVAFIGYMGTSENVGIFAGAPGSIQAVALQGQAAPAGGNYYTNLVDFRPVLNASGQVTFFSGLTGGSATHGIFAGSAGSLQTVALPGQAAPAGGNYSGLSDSPVLNGSGQVAFRASLTGGSATRGIFVGIPGTLQTVALTGQAAPAGGNYSSPFGLSDPVLNASGQVAFTSSLTGGSATNGLFTGTPGSLQAAALTGQAAPAGGNYNSFLRPVLNASGQIAFWAGLTGGSSTRGLFAGVPGSIQAVAVQGQAAPAGGNYNLIDFFPVLNGPGQVAFQTSLTGGSATQGIFAGIPGTLQTVALTGQAAPAGSDFGTLGRPVLNGSGQVAFLADLTGAGVTGANDRGLFAGPPGDLVKVVREGDVLDVDPTAGIDLRTVADGGIFFLPELSEGLSGGEDGRARSFADSGLLVYSLTFTDGTSGVFVTQLTPVPEPAGVLLVAGVTVLGGYFFRRSRQSPSATGADRPAG